MHAVTALQAGDAVWEGVRVYGGRVFHLAQHIARMISSAKALAFADIPTPQFIRVRRVLLVVRANAIAERRLPHADRQRHADGCALPRDAEPRREDHVFDEPQGTHGPPRTAG